MGLSQLGHELERLREARAQISIGETLDGGSGGPFEREELARWLRGLSPAAAQQIKQVLLADPDIHSDS